MRAAWAEGTPARRECAETAGRPRGGVQPRVGLYWQSRTAPPWAALLAGSSLLSDRIRASCFCAIDSMLIARHGCCSVNAYSRPARRRPSVRVGAGHRAPLHKPIKKRLTEKQDFIVQSITRTALLATCASCSGDGQWSRARATAVAKLQCRFEAPQLPAHFMKSTSSYLHFQCLLIFAFNFEGSTGKAFR